MNDDDFEKQAEGKTLEDAGVPNVPDLVDMSLDLTKDEKLRATALMMAVSYHKETIVKDGSMYQTMTAQGKNLRATHPRQVVEAALIFEGYLRGDYNELVAQVTLNIVSAIEDFIDAPAAPDADAAV